MIARDGSYRRIVDSDGEEHWVPIGRPPRQPSRFWRVMLMLVTVLAGGGAIAHSLPTTQSSEGAPYVARTLAPTTTIAPTTTKANGAAALACQALGFR